MRIDHHYSKEWSSRFWRSIGGRYKEFDSQTALLVSDQLPNLLRAIRVCGNQSQDELPETSFSVNIFGNTFEKSAEAQPSPLSVSPRIRLLLDPFTLLYGVGALEIKGTMNEEYKGSVISSARQPEPTTAKIITAALAMKNKGDEAFHQEQYDHSLSFYRLAIREVQVNHHPGTYTGSLNAIGFTGMSTEHAANIFIVRLQSALAAALVKVGEYERAVEYANLSLDGATAASHAGCASRYERATVSFWLGLAWEGLGDVDEAIGAMQLALEYCPEDKDFERELDRLMTKMSKIEPI